MVSPMREKRAWPPREKDADAEAKAAFEATVAVVKETVVRSGEVLVSAKEDLSDHQRWLKVQTAQVQADRERHDRWLQRQRERQETLERREQKRARRRQIWQAAMGAVTGAVAAAVFAVRSAISSVIGTIVGGLNAIDAAAASGLRFVGGKLRDMALHVVGAISRATGAAGSRAQALARSTASTLSSGVGSLGRMCAAGLAAVGAMSRAAALRASATLHQAAPSAGRFVSASFGGLGERVGRLSPAIAAWLATLGAKLRPHIRGIGEKAGPAFGAVAAKANAIAPSLYQAIGNAGRGAGALAKQSAARVQGFLPAKASASESENEVSSPQPIRGFEPSQMLIIAGALLLICGGLMLGGGLLMRAGAGSSSTVAEAAGSEPIAWLFEHKTLPIDERSVFDYVATAEGVRIKGFAIGGVNLSEHPVSAIAGIVKPDLQPHDLKLTLSVETPGEPGSEPQPAATEIPASGSIPSQAPFKLVFLFPTGANGGMSPQEVLAAYGGLMLKVRYEAEGKQRSFIQYLSPALLEEQLAEIAAEAKGS